MIELKPFRHEASFVVGEVTLRLVVDFETIERVERAFNCGLDAVLGQIAASTAAATKFIWFAIREHNPELSMDQIAGVMFSPEHGQALMATLGDLVERAFRKTSKEIEHLNA